MKKKVTIFGSTGSIGLSTLDIINQHSDKYEIVGLSINNNYEKLLEQVSTFKPKIVSIRDSKSFEKFKNKNTLKNLKILNGYDSFDDILDYETDIVVAAITGSAGLLPVVGAVKRGITIALANKESLVCSGSLVTSLAKKNGSMILPVDSEHNAIYQVLDLKNKNNVSKLILTASGGPFLNKKLDEMKNITPEQAVKHPNWSMGKKISVDSATMMNKVFEVIETQKIFNLPKNKISILLHEDSYLHAIVKFQNGITKLLIHDTNMEIPIFNTLYNDVNKSLRTKNLDFTKLNNLSLKFLNQSRFPIIKIIKKISNRDSLFETVIVACNDELVNLFLNKKINYIQLQKNLVKLLCSNKFSKYKLK